MNFVKITMDLVGMPVGQQLRVLLDDGEPIEKVPNSLIRDGQRIVEQQKMGDHWSLLILKVVEYGEIG